MSWRVPPTSRLSGALITCGWRPSLQVGVWGCPDTSWGGQGGTGKSFVLPVSTAWFSSSSCSSKELPLIPVLNCYMFWEKPLVIFVFWLFHCLAVSVEDWDLEMWYKVPFQ